MKKSHAFLLTLFLGIINAFASDDVAPNCSQHSNPDDTTFPGNMSYVRDCRNAGCTFKFNTPSSENNKDYRGECINFVESDCSIYDNANDCYSDPQCNFDNKKTCTKNKPCAEWRNDDKNCNKHNGADGNPCQPNARKKCDINTAGKKPNFPSGIIPPSTQQSAE